MQPASPPFNLLHHRGVWGGFSYLCASWAIVPEQRGWLLGKKMYPSHVSLSLWLWHCPSLCIWQNNPSSSVCFSLPPSLHSSPSRLSSGGLKIDKTFVAILSISPLSLSLWACRDTHWAVNTFSRLFPPYLSVFYAPSVPPSCLNLSPHSSGSYYTNCMFAQLDSIYFSANPHSVRYICWWNCVWIASDFSYYRCILFLCVASLMLHLHLVYLKHNALKFFSLHSLPPQREVETDFSTVCLYGC